MKRHCNFKFQDLAYVAVVFGGLGAALGFCISHNWHLAALSAVYVLGGGCLLYLRRTYKSSVLMDTENVYVDEYKIEPIKDSIAASTRTIEVLLGVIALGAGLYMPTWRFALLVPAVILVELTVEVVYYATRHHGPKIAVGRIHDVGTLRTRSGERLFLKLSDGSKVVLPAIRHTSEALQELNAATRTSGRYPNETR